VTLLWIGAGVVVLKLAMAAVDAIDDVPLLGILLELAGIWFTYRFVSQNLLTSQDRSRLVETYKAWQTEIFGQHRPRPIESRSRKAIKAAPAKPRLEPAAEPVTTVQALPQAGETVPQTKMFAGVVGTIQVLIPLTGVVDVDALKAKLEKDLGKIEAEIKALSGRLSNPGFVEKAPADVVQGARDALAEAETQAEILQSRLAML
jgi:valyl-tRNA synthetase